MHVYEMFIPSVQPVYIDAVRECAQRVIPPICRRLCSTSASLCAHD